MLAYQTFKQSSKNLFTKNEFGGVIIKLSSFDMDWAL